jgi:gluconate 2-dehydrogenase gamma chain
MYFDQHGWETVEAAMARIIPTDQEPGAKEAGAIRFLDRYLSGIDYVYARPDGSGFLRLAGKRARAWQQRLEALRRLYADGIHELDQRSRERFGQDFCCLAEREQDEILATMEPKLRIEEPMQAPTSEEGLDFLRVLILHTRQGFYADPIYGGNIDRVGWKLVDFPGPSSLAEAHAGHYSTESYFA